MSAMNIVVPKSSKARVTTLHQLSQNGHWEFPEPMGKGKAVGFLYAIVDTYLQRGYIGKKLYRGTGVKNAGKESNWKTYKSSSKTLEPIFKVRGTDEFRFICLEEYVAKGALSYAETWTLCHVEAPTSNVWYNTRVEAISWNVRERITERHKLRLEEVLKEIGK